MNIHELLLVRKETSMIVSSLKLSERVEDKGMREREMERERDQERQRYTSERRFIQNMIRWQGFMNKRFRGQ